MIIMLTIMLILIVLIVVIVIAGMICMIHFINYFYHLLVFSIVQQLTTPNQGLPLPSSFYADFGDSARFPVSRAFAVGRCEVLGLRRS